MSLNRPECKLKNTEQGKSRGTYKILSVLVFFMFLFCINSGFAQWVSNPAENTRLVIEGSNPVDIGAVKDGRGGAFIFWQDGKGGFSSEVFFIHVDSKGKVTLRADGKKVAGLVGPEEAPVAASSLPNTAAVVWKDLALANSGNLLAQRVTSTGNYIWSSRGVDVTTGSNVISSYSARSNNKGALFISYVSRKSGITSPYNLKLQKLSPKGKLLIDKDSTTIYSSGDRISSTSMVADNGNGIYLFWLQYHNYTSMLLAQHFDSAGHPLWGKEPVKVSGRKDNVMLYSAVKLNYPAVYIAWQTQKNDKDIYHQIITSKGKNIWTAGGILATPQTGKQTNPDAVVSDSSVILCWTQEAGKDKDIYLQKFNKRGNAVWNKYSVPVIKYKGDQFGQKMISDGNGGAIIAWIDRRNDSTFADIYAQKINSKGQRMWDSLGLKVGTNFNSLKSYLSLLTDENGGAIAVFKNKRDKKNGIYGQRIFSSGTYASQIVGFNTGLKGDSVKVYWYSANEEGKTKYTIERTNRMDTDSVTWENIGYIYSDGLQGVKLYNYYDLPDETGTLYYRVVQSDTAGVIQTSDISRINYFGSSPDVVIAQNVPNPFSDSTEISFYLPDTDNVKIEFYNSRVEKIKEIDKSFPSGENNITFSAKGLKPGIYFYRFNVKGVVNVKKMVVIK